MNNVLGQILLARRMGKTRIIAETGAGQHGVATATLCARFGLDCVVYMGAVDVERQKPNVFRMKMLGAEVRPVQSGSQTLKDAMNEALRDWVTNVDDTFYCIGTVAGPHPYPTMVRDFQSVIGRETREQMLAAEGRLPDSLVACIGGGSNAMGLFHPFLDDREHRDLRRRGGRPRARHGLHAASIAGGRPACCTATAPICCRTTTARSSRRTRSRPASTIPGIGPEHAWLHDIGRVNYLSATDDEALDAFQLCCRLEGIIPALEPAHALAKVMELAPKMPKDHLMVMNMCGRGDKDIFTVAEHLGDRVVSARIDSALRRTASGEGRAGAGDLPHGRRSRLRDLARDPAGAAGGRRRHDRARHAVHRPDGRRAGDPGRRSARAQGRADA